MNKFHPGLLEGGGKTQICFSGKYGFLPLNIQSSFCLIGSLSSEIWRMEKTLREGVGGNTVGGAAWERMGTSELEVGIRKQFQSAELKSQSRRVTEGVQRGLVWSLQAAGPRAWPSSLCPWGAPAAGAQVSHLLPSAQDVQHVEHWLHGPEAGLHPQQPSFRNLGLLIEQMKKNGARFVLVLVGI